MGYHGDVVGACKANADFRRVLFTTDRAQLVLMSLRPGEDIGLEVHGLDQLLFVVSGTGRFVAGEQEGALGPGHAVHVPAGEYHNVLNTGEAPLRLYTVYAPPEHAPGTVHRTKADAVAAEAAEREGRVTLSEAPRRVTS